MQPERRRSPRYPLDLEIQVDGGTGFTKNLSSHGVYFETDRALEPQQEVALVFPFEHAAPSGTRATCSARVLRVERRGQRYCVAATYDAVGFDIP